MATTTMQVSHELLKELKSRKMFDKESYEEVIWDLIEDTKELSEETKRNIREAEEDIKAGRVYTNEQFKKKFNL